MTRGDQRERAREKSQKKAVGQNKGTQLPDGMSLAQKKHADAEIMRLKQLKAQQEREQAGSK